MIEILTNIHDNLMDVQRIPVLVFAYIITVMGGMVVGAYRGNANPLAWWILDFLFGRAGDKLNRNNRSAQDLLTRGLLFSLILVSMCLIVGQQIDMQILKHADWAWEICIVCLFITSGAVWFTVLRVFMGLDGPRVLPWYYYALECSNRLHLCRHGHHGITREGIAYLAISFDKGLVAPSLWYLVGGVPLLMMHAAVSFVVWRYGQFGKTKGFGKVGLLLEKIMGYGPSLLAGFLLVCAATIISSAQLYSSLRQWLKNRNVFAYEEHGLTLSAIAWPLDVHLGGSTKDLSGLYFKRAWVGPHAATTMPERDHLKRAMFLNVTAHLLFIFMLLVVYVYAVKFV